MEILELMFIVRRLQPYVRNSAKRSVVGMPKLHIMVSGLACHLLGQKNPDTFHTSQFYGNMVETFVFTELLKHSTWSDDDAGFYHFRDNSGHEVDLVLEQGDGRVTGIEVKASMTVRQEDFKGLSVFADYAKERFVRGVLFYTGGNVLPFKMGGRSFHAVPMSFLFG